MYLKKRTIALILATVLALSLLLTACSNGGDTPSGDNTTPDVTDTETPSSTPSATDIPPDDTTKPDSTPSEANPSTPDTSSTPEVNKAAEYEAGGQVEEYKVGLDDGLANVSQIAGIDVENAIDEIYQKYGEYLNANITKDAIKVGVVYGIGSPFYKPFGGNLTGISPDAMEMVNDSLIENGEDALDSKIPEQSIAALWLAASMYYDPDVTKVMPGNYNLVAFDIAMAFGLARADSSSGSAEKEADAFWSPYAALFDLY